MPVRANTEQGGGNDFSCPPPAWGNQTETDPDEQKCTTAEGCFAMRLLYRAQHLYDARMVLNLLLQHDLRGWIEGAALTGAAGELPVHDVVRVMVHDDDFAAAKNLLQDWESGSFSLPMDDSTTLPADPTETDHWQSPDTTEPESGTVRITSWLGAATLLLAALIIIIGAAWGFFLPLRP